MRIVTGNVFFDEHVGKHGDDPERAHFGEVIHHGRGALGSISPAQGGRHGPHVQDRDVKQLAASMLM
jgi:hypothetical protein